MQSLFILIGSVCHTAKLKVKAQSSLYNNSVKENPSRKITYKPVNTSKLCSNQLHPFHTKVMTPLSWFETRYLCVLTEESFSYFNLILILYFKINYSCFNKLMLASIWAMVPSISISFK